MTVLSSLYSGVSGINANGTSLSVIGNNIANTNTVGFKGSRTVFSDVLSGTAGRQPVGRGVLVSAIDKDLSQGSFETTGNVLDLAIDGEGFFLVNDGVGNSYTRAGVFGTDKDGVIVNPEGLALMGFQADAVGNISGSLGSIQLKSNISDPNPTGNVLINSNLDSRSPLIPGGFDLSNPVGTSNHSNAISVVDSLGRSHLATVYYSKASEAPTGNTWNWYTVVGSADTLSGVDEVQASGTLTFNSAGALADESAPSYWTGWTAAAGSGTATTGFNFDGGANLNQVIAFDFGQNINSEAGSGLDGTTQYGVISSTSFQTQDGFAPGELQSVNISGDGLVEGLFNNGESRIIAQLAVATFNNPKGLNSKGSNQFSESFSSGQPNIGVGESGGRGRVLSNSLELSNVDLAAEFIKMIAAQRAFQANSRVITSTDEVLRDMVNIIR
ncbi:MAG: flagellar hook protein FlgE [Nitrospirae bacterium]|nr:flagellar hook protein FlgE [Nitrospirota bacterium]